MSHANAALTPRARLRLARLIVEGWLVDIPGCRAVPGVLDHGESVGTALPRPGRGRHGRSVQPPAPQSDPNHSRIAYPEIHDDETAATAVAVLRRAVAWFAARGVITRRVLSDNGSAYRSRLWRQGCAELGITPKRTRPYRPQTNGKICEDCRLAQRRTGLTLVKV